MHNPRKTIDSVRVTSSTDFAISIASDCIQHALEYQSDFRKKERLKDNECKTCFYFRSGRIGGAAMTTQECAVCGKEVMYGSTNTDPLCLECAQAHELCKRCMGDVKMRPRRIYKA